MLPLDDERFGWDDANRAHVREAGIEPEEAEEALLDPQRVAHDVYNLESERRRGIVGATEAGNMLFVVFTIRQGRIRVITARPATAREKRRFRRRGK